MKRSLAGLHQTMRHVSVARPGSVPMTVLLRSSAPWTRIVAGSRAGRSAASFASVALHRRANICPTTTLSFQRAFSSAGRVAASVTVTRGRPDASEPQLGTDVRGLVARGEVGDHVLVKGWVRSARAQKAVGFVNVNDGSNVGGIQVVASSGAVSALTTGCAVVVRGVLVESPGKGQDCEIHAEDISVVGQCPAADYPLQKKGHSMEYLREICHLRPRSNIIAAVTRVRNTLSMAVHNSLQEEGCLLLHTPVITSNDCEGAGELFDVRRSGGSGADDDLFFGTNAYLTVSGQLQAEMFASALSRVYTFGPTFRAENSNTSRHLAEFWMVEPELANANLDDVIDLAELVLRNCCRAMLDGAEEELAFFERFVDKSVRARLAGVVDCPLARMTYTEAIEVLLRSNRSFEREVVWGVDLHSEHERYLSEEHVRGPVAVTNYPRDIKPFYMRQNDDGKTVACVDVLVPGIGEIIGGSAREERYDKLHSAMEQHGLLDGGELDWYLDLRQFGSVPHAGWGLGFERLVQFVTGIDNIRDAIPLPRVPGSCRT